MTYGNLLSQDDFIRNNGAGLVQLYAMPNRRVVKITVWLPPREGTYCETDPTAVAEILDSSGQWNGLLSYSAVIARMLADGTNVDLARAASDLHHRVSLMLRHLDGGALPVMSSSVVPMYVGENRLDLPAGTLLAVYNDSRDASRVATAVNSDDESAYSVYLGFAVGVDPEVTALGEDPGGLAAVIANRHTDAEPHTASGVDADLDDHTTP